MRTVTRAAVLILATLVLMPSLALARDAFNGTWQVTITPDEEARKAGEKESKDTFTFGGSEFESKTFKAKGFPKVNYEEDTRAGIVASFKAVSKNKKDGSEATWSGTSTAGEMQGELIVKKKDGTELKYTIKGTRDI